MERLALMHWYGTVLYPGEAWRREIALLWFARAAEHGSALRRRRAEIQAAEPAARPAVVDQADLPSSVKCSTTGGDAKKGPTMARHSANSGPPRKATVWSSSVSQKIISR